MLDYTAQYGAKKCSPEQAVLLIHSGDAVLAAGGPGALLGALYGARARFDGLRLYTLLGLGGDVCGGLYAPDAAGHIAVTSGILSASEEAAWMGGCIDQAPIHLSVAEQYLDSSVKPTVLLAHCPPPDDEGYFCMGLDDGGFSVAAMRYGRVIVQVNPRLPRIHSDSRIHISRVAAICEHDAPIPMPEAYSTKPDAADIAIAGHIAELIPHGATLQLGPGFLPYIAGQHLADHKGLGIHSDCFSDAFIGLIRKGAVDNSQKALMKGVSVGSYFIATEENLAFLDNNPDVMMRRLNWVCDPKVIAQIGNVHAINQAVAVDFRGQFCCGSLGMAHSGGAGSELDFARGVKRGGQGKFIMAMRSASMGEDGKLASNIYPGLPEGSLVSVPRSDIMYIVTEYGASDLRDLSVKDRVKELVRLAHPDFRDWLLDEALKHGFLIQ
jgi:4-hydroxybutyrate CoA-transferase